MRRFWITLPIAFALAASTAYAGKLDSVEQTAKTYIAKKETTNSAGHGVTRISHGKAGKASQLLGKGKKILGK
jgi:hypothetical protein